MKTYIRFMMLLLLIGSGAMIYWFSMSQELPQNEPPCGEHFICGTPSLLLDSVAQKGRALYNSNCLACHKLDAKMTGPALRGVASAYKKAKLNLYQYLHGTRKHTLYNGKFKDSCAVFPQLTKQEISAIETYIQ
ncbi:cytochrome c [Flavobacterium sp. BFFFF1]|uniref:c-type cytochrome n=1 Tax=Flavobacterium sp. BFFFF1 TaxID=2015557 RepID=UPI0025C062DB|nr:cytochrome c [Flavobacterium sp. BFFFF1]